MRCLPDSQSAMQFVRGSFAALAIMNSQHWRGTLFADYFQFYLWDEEASRDAPTDWSDNDVSRHLT
jgi:hypothetical protein